MPFETLDAPKLSRCEVLCNFADELRRVTAIRCTVQAATKAPSDPQKVLEEGTSKHERWNDRQFRIIVHTFTPSEIKIPTILL